MEFILDNCISPIHIVFQITEPGFCCQIWQIPLCNMEATFFVLSLFLQYMAIYVTTLSALTTLNDYFMESVFEKSLADILMDITSDLFS